MALIRTDLEHLARWRLANKCPLAIEPFQKVVWHSEPRDRGRSNPQLRSILGRRLHSVYGNPYPYRSAALWWRLQMVLVDDLVDAPINLGIILPEGHSGSGSVLLFRWGVCRMRFVGADLTSAFS